jgi:chromosome segregation ATPase
LGWQQKDENMLARLKPDPPTAWQTAQARYRAAFETRQELMRSVEARTLALSLARNPTAAACSRTDDARKEAGPFLKIAARRPEVLEEEIRALGYEIEDTAKAFQAERDAYNEAVRAESNRVATELAPKHQAAVRRIAKAIEELSRACSAERDIRAEFAARAPEPVSARLPPMDGVWGCLGEANSMLSGWARVARRLGYLEGVK